MSKSLKIAIIGYGKMGKLIAELATKKGHQVISKIDYNATAQDWELLKNADVAIEFTNPHSAVENIKKCIEFQIPVVVGTTGWYEQYNDIKKYCEENNSTLFTATNFSMGVNIFFHLNSVLAEIMNENNSYDVSMTEIHHTHKLDAPSGTAITTAETIISKLKNKLNWNLKGTKDSPESIAIDAIRKDEVPGTHIVNYTSEVDTIEITHIAHQRTGFGTGALQAAEWCFNKKGVFTMKDLIGF